MKVIFLALIVFAFGMFLLGIGVILTGRCLRGSCGGPSEPSKNGEELTCGSCGRKKQIHLPHNQS